MGYERSTLTLTWPEESEFYGLEIQVKRLTVRQLTQVQKLGEKLTESTIAELIVILSKSIIKWNLEEDGVPLDVSVEVLQDVDIALVQAVIETWIEVAVGVPLASKKTSSDGETLPDTEWAALLNQEPLPTQS